MYSTLHTLSAHTHNVHYLYCTRIKYCSSRRRTVQYVCRLPNQTMRYLFQVAGRILFHQVGSEVIISGNMRGLQVVREKSINAWINQSMHGSINQCMDQSINAWINQ